MDADDPDLWKGKPALVVVTSAGAVWLPAMPEVQAKLERGALVADVGCGREGR